MSPADRSTLALAGRYGAATLRTYGILIALIILVVIVFAGNPAFLSEGNIFNMLSQWAPAGIMAVGMTYVILTGGFDLSVASGYSLCAVTAAAVSTGEQVSIALVSMSIRHSPIWRPSGRGSRSGF